ncbi:tail protein X [Actinomycetospora flava]|uniref:Tail protein X n=1 Tax=Actinomycetospora flava TaxID=3129232 RepID=A0ABU8M5G4_9PSEU
MTAVPTASRKRREVRYLRRRPLPEAGTVAALAHHRVLTGDRLDLLAARYYGDSTAWWRIAEANDALDPDTLTGPDAVGAVLVIPVPEA